VSSAQRDETDAHDPLWIRLREEAQEAYGQAAVLAPLFVDSILAQPTFEAALIHRIAVRLANSVLGVDVLVRTFRRAAESSSAIGSALRADIAAVLERDPACERLIEPFLYFKGFHAIGTHRFAHWLWNNGERDFALYLQSRSSDVSKRISIRRRGLGRASSSITRPGWSSVRQPSSKTMFRCSKTSRWEAPERKLATGIPRSGGAP